MKKMLIVLFLVFLTNSYPQQITKFDVTIFPNLLTLDFGSLTFINQLAGAPQIFLVEIEPKNISLRMRGEIDWIDFDGKLYPRFLSFATYQFESQDFFNSKLGNGIELSSFNIPQEIANKIMKKGKPSGTFKFRFYLTSASGNPYDDINILTLTNGQKAVVEKEVEFLNPTQSLTIISPTTGNYEDPGNVVAQWTALTGVTEYKIRANNRLNSNQSLEDALKQGNPLINDRSVGLTTTVNLRTILDREWEGGQEIVLQVSALVEGPGGGEKLSSNIVSFFLTNPNAASLSFLTNNMINMINNMPGLNISEGFKQKLLNGEIQIEDQILVDGKPISFLELTNLLNELGSDPDRIISIQLPE